MATAKAHTNIALIKYWGKKDQDLIIPQTDSLSMALDEFYTTTRVSFDPALTADQITVNDQPVTGDGAARITRFLDIVRQLSGRHEFAHVDSHNHVPTAAGLASSASAFAALAGAASRAAGLDLSRRDLSRLARRGSGSATRSIYGGLVEWHRGHDDASSYAEPIMEKVDFGLEMLAIMVSTGRKKISSRYGMQSSVISSPYYDSWKEVVESDMATMKAAIAAHDIQAIGHTAEENALRMHALTLSADPGYTYFNSETLSAIAAVRRLREQGINCYFTMDAGPNVKVIYDRADRDRIVDGLAQTFDRDRLVVSQAGPGIEIWDENN